ncbi:hypothetical protein DFR24_0373 [Panacagrimonas perspica]|uniref:Copper-binding protein MbnP-like domain-containing protein n=1 Tax=Panacagrimonas perspica TaxID=381431 RepID=A0A4S3K1Q4_9GAMM|nr:MbnP family protein [Panacagrimonas perspica]TDU31015.1 hypothetical protein DFR24_0373 [Panacagrimonas perspica]THD01836.1 hypothetical protein B1810_17700 [Panacagrimonas perspica]
MPAAAALSNKKEVAFPAASLRGTGLRVLAAALLLASTASCSKPGATESGQPVEIGVRIEHQVNGQPFALGVDYPQPEQAPLRVTRLNYYLGRFRLQHEDGRWFSSAAPDDSPGDYRLIDVAQAPSLQFGAIRVPPGRYKTLEFLVGVDEARNAGGAQTGALDPAGGMFWTWKSGYIFFALEGHSTASGDSDGAITFHIGGDARLARTLVLPLGPDALVVKSGEAPVVQLRADVGRFFEGLPLATTHTVMSPDGADGLADRYAGWFSVGRASTGTGPS